ncbi:MAG: c-type cytochrome [Akkermansiaceae bacterium]
MRLINYKLWLGVYACLVFSAAVATAQQGDRKDRKGTKQIDPIPAEKIPPSPYLSLNDAIKSFKLADGYVIEPVASGKHVHMAVALAFDANGRAWTAEMRSYMPNLDGKGEDKPDGQIRVLEDTDGDGKIDKATTFLDGLVLPRAVAVTSDGCLYTSGDALYFTKRNGLKPTGEPTLIDENYARGGNPEHKGNGLLYGHDNWYYNAKSNLRYRRINGKWISQSTDMRGQWGIAKDNAGRLYHNSNSTLLVGDQFTPDLFRGNPDYTPSKMPTRKLGSNAVHPIRITPGLNRAYQPRTLDKEGKLANATAACGVHIYRGDNFPKEMQGMGFACEPGGDLIKAVKIKRDQWNKPSGSHPYGEEEFLASTDEWFLPCNIYTAPDGTMWIVDMYFGLLQHKAYMTSYLRKQYENRGLDKPKPSTGRIYRVRYKKSSISEVPKLEGKKPTDLVSYLAHPNGTVRDTAQRLIVESGDKSVQHDLHKTASNKNNPLGQIHAIWTLDGLGIYDTAALANALRSNHHGVVNNALAILANLHRTSEFERKILRIIPADQKQTLHALIRAMAANGLHRQALELISKNNKAPYLREAFISGLGTEANEFKKKHPELKDKELNKHLASATKKKSKNEKPDGAHLKGKLLASFERGKEFYITKAACFGCHGGDGQGMPNLGPPLVKSEWVTESPERLTKLLLHGMTGPVTVNGKLYKPAAAMPGIKDNTSLTNSDIADVMNYIRNAWGNRAKPVEAILVKKIRTESKDRRLPYTEKELR